MKAKEWADKIDTEIAQMSLNTESTPGETLDQLKRIVTFAQEAVYQQISLMESMDDAS